VTEDHSSELPKRDRADPAKRVAERRERDARREDGQGFSVNIPGETRPSHPDGWQTGGRGDSNR
jgi:hypothetical protein